MISKSKKSYFFSDKRSGEKIRYIGAESLKNIHPDGDYIVIGEIAIKEMNDCGIEKEILEADTSIYIQPIGTYQESQYKTVGFIPCVTEGEYIAVKKKKKTKLIAGILLILLLLSMSLGGYFMMKGNGLDIDPNATNYESTLKRPDNIDSSQILIPGYGKFTIDVGSNTIDTVLFNPEGNPCFFKFTLLEKDTKDVLYESKLVPPGKGVTPIKLNKTFNKAGTYELVLKFESVDLEDTNITYNGSNIDVKLNVE